MNDLRETIQKQAYEAWEAHNKRGTIVLHTGGGKTRVAIKAILESSKGSNILFLAETTLRENTFNDELKKYIKEQKCNPLEDKNFTFACYQSAYKWKGKHFNLVICDECHDSFTESYSQFYANNTFDAIMGLTATPKIEVEYEGFRKGDLYDKYCPIIFRYELQEGIESGTSRKLNVFIVQHLLDNKDASIMLGKRKLTERQMYDYHHRNFVRKMMSSAPANVITFFASLRANFLYSLNSKIELCKQIIELMEEKEMKTIIFGNSIPSLVKIVKTVISSKNSEIKNDKILESFNKGKISTIASFKMLQQGANLAGLDNVLLHSYYGKSGLASQRIGRARLNGDLLGNIIIICTIHTAEENWLKKMLVELKAKEGYVNYYSCFGVEDFKVKFNKVN